MLAADFTAGKLWFGVGGTWVNGGNPATGANPTLTFTPGDTWYLFAFLYADGGA
jgi:hypothetical protein